MVECFENVPYTTYDPLKPDEEQTIFHDLQELEGDRRDQLIDKILRCNTRFVISEVDKIIKSRLFSIPIKDLEDLRDDMVAYGLVGLLSPIETFDPDRGVRFLTYARWSVHSKIILALMESYSIRIPGAHQVNYVAFDEDTTQLTDWEHQEFGFGDPFMQYSTAEDAEILLDQIERLGTKEAYVILTYFGFNCQPTRLETIGDDLGLGREWVRQIRDRALAILADKRPVQEVNMGA